MHIVDQVARDIAPYATAIIAAVVAIHLERRRRNQAKDDAVAASINELRARMEDRFDDVDRDIKDVREHQAEHAGILNTLLGFQEVTFGLPRHQPKRK